MHSIISEFTENSTFLEHTSAIPLVTNSFSVPLTDETFGEVLMHGITGYQISKRLNLISGSS